MSHLSDANKHFSLYIHEVVACLSKSGFKCLFIYMRSLLAYENLVPLKKIFFLQHSTVRIQGFFFLRLFYLPRYFHIWHCKSYFKFFLLSPIYSSLLIIFLTYSPRFTHYMKYGICFEIPKQKKLYKALIEIK